MRIKATKIMAVACLLWAATGAAQAATLGLTTEAPAFEVEGAFLAEDLFGDISATGTGTVTASDPIADGTDFLFSKGFFGEVITIQNSSGQEIFGSTNLLGEGAMGSVAEFLFGPGATDPFGGSVLVTIDFGFAIDEDDPFAGLDFFTGYDVDIAVAKVVDPNVIPLPASAFLLAVGILGLGALRARRQLS